MTNTSTPPNQNLLKTLFPMESNLHLIDALAAGGHRLFVVGNYILFEGDPVSTNRMKQVLAGGVTA